MEEQGPITRNEVTNISLFSNFISLTYAFVGIGLAITFGIGFFIVEMLDRSPQLFDTLSALFFPILIIELILVIAISAIYEKVNWAITAALFVAYSVLNAIFFGVILSLYTLDSVIVTFLATGLTFFVMSTFGYLTNQDLTKWGNIALMGLFGFIIGSVINIFVASESLYWILTYAGIAIFLVLIARDTQRLKEMSAQLESENAPVAKYAIRAALGLYLDLINLFLLLLRIFGGRK